MSVLTLHKPKALQPGGTIAIISPAAPTAAPTETFAKGKALLENAGFNVVLMPHCHHQNAYLAGTDAERLADLHAAFGDSAIDAIVCARGGYGCMRLLPDIDFDLIRQNPKVFVGFSDITALHTAFYQQAGLVGFYGPMLTSNLLVEAEKNEIFSQTNLFEMITGNEAYPKTVLNRDPFTCFQAGRGQGPLIGGNLSLLTALCGTPWQPQTAGHLLFVEDWHESYYTLDRQFQQLKLAGLFEGITGLLLCDFSEIPDEYDYPLTDHLRRITLELGLSPSIPIGYGFSVGHGAVTATLPIGVNALFDSTTGQLTLLESPVTI